MLFEISRASDAGREKPKGKLPKATRQIKVKTNNGEEHFFDVIELDCVGLVRLAKKVRCSLLLEPPSGDNAPYAAVGLPSLTIVDDYLD